MRQIIAEKVNQRKRTIYFIEIIDIRGDYLELKLLKNNDKNEDYPNNSYDNLAWVADVCASSEQIRQKGFDNHCR